MDKEEIRKIKKIVEDADGYLDSEGVEMLQESINERIPEITLNKEEKRMKTFVAENVLCDYTSGLVVVKAKNIEEAIKIINNSKKIYSSGKGEIITNLREMKNNELVYVHGGS